MWWTAILPCEDQFDDVIVEDQVIIQTVTEEEELDHAVGQGSHSHNGAKLMKMMWTKSTRQPPLEKYYVGGCLEC